MEKWRYIFTPRLLSSRERTLVSHLVGAWMGPTDRLETTKNNKVSRWNKNRQGNLSTRREPAPVSLCPQRIPHDLTRARTRATAVGIWRLIT
jgi:hypothetical protein